MSELTWKNWTPQYDGHAPDDWADGMPIETDACGPWTQLEQSLWHKHRNYRYRPAQDAKPDLLAQCLSLPQADRDALIEALQRDWADEVAGELWPMSSGPYNVATDAMAAVIRSMCRPKEDELLGEIFDFLGGVDDAVELRGKLLKVINS